MTLGRACVLAITTAVILNAEATTALAAEFKIDNGHSAIIFKVKNRDISFVYGRFMKISGTITADKVRRPTRLRFRVEIAAKSVDSNNKKRDKHIKGADFFNSRSFPKITFESKRSKRLENGLWEITGELDFHGVKKELTVMFQQTGLRELAKDTYRLGGESTFTLKRSDFGMDNMSDSIADDVTVIVNIEAECKIVPSG